MKQEEIGFSLIQALGHKEQNVVISKQENSYHIHVEKVLQCEYNVSLSFGQHCLENVLA